MNIFKFLLPFLGLFSNHCYTRLKAVNGFRQLLAPVCSIGEGGGTVAEMELLEKVRTKTGEEIDKRLNEYSKGIINRTEFQEALKSISEKLDDAPKQIKVKYDEIMGILEKQGELLKSMRLEEKNFGRQLSKDEKVKLLIAYAVQTEEYKNYEKHMKGNSPSFKLTNALEALDKKTVTLTSDYSGTVMITEQSGKVIGVPMRERHVRDLLDVYQTDQPNIVAQEVYDWTDSFTGSATMLAENTAATQGAFKVRENTWGMKRIAAFYDLSKRMLKTNGLSWVVSYLGNILPSMVKTVEDDQLLYGDGAGNNVTGLSSGADAVSFAGGSFIAGAFSSVATYASGTKALITFAAAHGMRSGDILTIAASANYNGSYRVRKISNTQIIITATYVAEATAAWTGTYVNPFYQKIDDAQEIDVLKATLGYMSYKDRMIDAFIINPVDAIKMLLLKDTSGRYLNDISVINDIIHLRGTPCIESNAVTGGEFFGIRRGAQYMQLAEFTSLNLFFTDDVTYAKENRICAVIEEEVIFPIYEPLSVVYGVFDTLKTQLETP